MTIAAGMKTEGGAVMFADSQETSGDFKWPVEKLVTADLFGRGSIMISGAGFGDAIDYAAQQIIHTLRSSGFDLDRALKCIKEILRDIYRNDLRYYPTDVKGETQFFLIITIKSSEMRSPLIYKTSGSLINLVRDYAIIGSGSVVNYSAHTLYQPYMSMSQAVMLAAHLIRLAKSQLTSVGGTSRIATMDNTGEIKFASPWELPNTEQLFGEFLGTSGNLMLQCADPDFSQEQFSKSLGRFLTTATRLKKEQIENRELWEKAFSALSGKADTRQENQPNEATEDEK